jgi:hypothetical protein
VARDGRDGSERGVMRYGRRFCGDCKNYSVHFNDGEREVCIHHGKHERDGFRVQSIERMTELEMGLLNKALDMTYEAISRGRQSPALPLEDSRGVA